MLNQLLRLEEKMRINYFRFLNESSDHRYTYDALVPTDDGTVANGRLSIFPHWEGKHVVVTQHNPSTIRMKGLHITLD